MAKKRPFCEATRRRNIQGALWQNRDGNGNPFYVTSLTRSYKDKNDQWQNEIVYLPLDDVPRAIAVLRELETTAYRQMQADYDASNADQATEESVPVGSGADDNF